MEIQQRRSRYEQDRRIVVRGLYLPDCCRHYPTFFLPVNKRFMNFEINKGIGRNVEFKGLESQYLFVFAAGLSPCSWYS